MNQVKTLTIEGSGMVPNGGYVRKEDYTTLQQKLNAVLAENVALKESRKRLGEFIVEEIDADYPLNMEIQTTATDVILNEVRAEGAIAVRDALVVAEEGADLYAIATKTADQLRAGSTEGGV